MKSLITGGVASAAVKVLSAGLTFLMFMFLARVLEPTEFGHFATMFALGSTIAVVALLGQNLLSLRTLSALDKGRDAGPARRAFLKRSFLFVVSGSAVLSGSLVAYWWLDATFDLGVGGRLALGASLFVLPFAVADLVSHQYRALGSISWALLPRDVVWRSIVIALCLGATLVPWIFSSAFSAMATVSAVLTLVVFAHVAGLRSLVRRADAGEPSGRKTVHTSTNEPFSVWLWIAPVLAMGASLTVVVAAPFLPADEIGAFFAAQKTAQLLQLPKVAIGIVAAPIFARLHATADVDAMQVTARRLSIIILLPLAIGAFFLIWFASELLALFDPAFSFASSTVIVLAVGWLVVGLGGPANQLLLMTGRERDFVRLTAVCELIGLVLIPASALAFGLIGVAVAAIVPRVVLTILLVITCRRHVLVDTSIASLFSK